MDLTTHTLPTQDLHPHPNNPRNGDTDAIADSLRVNGQYRPIVVTEDGTILAGNHTWMAACELGWGTIEAVRLPVAPDSPEALRIMVADNRTSDRAWYDHGLLVPLLDELEESERGLAGTGYDGDDLDDLRNVLDAMALADAANEGDVPDDYDGDKVDVTSNLQTVNVVVEKDHRADFYRVITSLPYVTDARDAKR